VTDDYMDRRRKRADPEVDITRFVWPIVKSHTFTVAHP